MKSKKKNQIIIETPDNEKSGSGMSIGSALFFGLLVVGGIAYGGKLFADSGAQNEAGQLQDNAFTQWAARVKNLIDGYTSDADINELLKIASQITDWTKVVSAYSILTKGSNLNDDISSAMGRDAYAVFLENLKMKGRPATKSGNFVIENKVPPAGISSLVTKLIVGSRVDSQIKLYKELTDAPAKPALIFNASQNLAPVTFISAHALVDYRNPQRVVAYPYYKISLSNGSVYFISDEDIKGRLNGLDGLGCACNELKGIENPIIY